MFRVDPNTLTIIGLDTDDGPEHQLWDERINDPLNESMIKNIMALGVIEPIIVVVEGAGDSRRAVVVDGRGRTRHAREANRLLKERGEPGLVVPVVAEKGMSEKDQQLFAVSLNEIRRDDPVMVKAAKAARMKQRGSSSQDIALAFGVDPQTVSLWLSINGLSDDVKEAINAGWLGPTAAGQLASLTPSEQKETLAGLKAARDSGEKLTVANVRGQVKTKKGSKKNNGAEAHAPAPGRRVLRRVIENGGEVLSEDFLQGIRFAIGELSPKTIKGLTALMNTKS
jgi:ParB-like chromosome segregation protein Spo0J